MQSISVFLDITKVTDFRWKNADVSRMRAVCHVIYTGFFIMKQPKLDLETLQYLR